MKRLLILSGKGGTGKTTVSAAIIRLSQARAIADCDVDAPNLHLIMKPSEVTPEQFVFMGGEKAAVQQNRCIGCGKCLSLCRFDAIQMENGKASINEYACEGCGVCQFVCPEHAITLEQDAAGTRELYFIGICIFHGNAENGARELRQTGDRCKACHDKSSSDLRIRRHLTALPESDAP